MAKEYRFEQLDKSRLATLIKWAREEGWNIGLSDPDAFWEADPEGFYGFIDGKKLIAGGATIVYDDGKYGFMGLFIVHPDYRGKGIGKKLWYKRRDHLLSRLEEGASIGMDGVVDMQGFYKKGGFKLDHKNFRMKGEGRKYLLPAEVSVIAKKNRKDILSYDKEVFGFDRETFMRAWIYNKNNTGYKYIVNEQIKGFSVLRRAEDGYKIGPLFVDNIRGASALMKAMFNQATGTNIYLDIPENNPSAKILADKFNMEKVFETGRMYYGDPPSIPQDKVFGVTSFELG